MVFKSKPFFAYFVSNAWVLNKVVVLDVAAGYADFTKGEEKLHLPTKRKKKIVKLIDYSLQKKGSNKLESFTITRRSGDRCFKNSSQKKNTKIGLCSTIRHVGNVVQPTIEANLCF